VVSGWTEENSTNCWNEPTDVLRISLTVKHRESVETTVTIIRGIAEHPRIRDLARMIVRGITIPEIATTRNLANANHGSANCSTGIRRFSEAVLSR
jgi:hypothetical protein